jgi:hypothetical protein
MSTRLRELAREASMEARPEARGAEIERVVLDVRVGDRVELVTLSMREGRLRVVASDGDAASSAAARAALEWLASDLPRESLPPSPGERATAPTMGATTPIAAAIADLATAIVRAGTDSPDSPAIADALARIAVAAPSLTVLRWVGRVRAALASRDELSLARWLDGARELEAAETVTRVVDRVYVELGRELVDGLSPSSIERRHLVDPASGEVLAEERPRDQAGASNGPCPRVVSAGLAMRNAAGRVRVVQYAVALLDAEVLARVDALAVPLAAAFARAEAEGLRSAAREPVSLVKLGELDAGIVHDAAGQPIPLARHEDAAAASALVAALSGRKGSWLLGRWSLAGDEASLVPLSCCVDGRVVRLR